MECVALVDDRYAATLRFRDRPRAEGAAFIHHLGPRHHFERVLLLSGDRESEVRYLAEQVGIGEVFFSQSPGRSTGSADGTPISSAISTTPGADGGDGGRAFDRRAM
jgi:hypothetical protein